MKKLLDIKQFSSPEELQRYCGLIPGRAGMKNPTNHRRRQGSAGAQTTNKRKGLNNLSTNLKNMDPKVEEELIGRLKEYYGKMSLKQLQSKLGVPKNVFLYLLGRAGLPLEQARIQTITVVHWKTTKEGGSAPTLRVSRYITRKMGLKDGDKVQWTIEKNRIVGIPLTIREAHSEHFDSEQD